MPPCGSAACPVAAPTSEVLRSIRTRVVGTDRTWWRSSRLHPEALAPPGTGDTRFAPLADTAHGYVGATRTVALLETALHAASGPDPTIFVVTLAGWAVSGVELTAALRLADLRDPQLARLGIPRSALVDTTPRHYPCTREWAKRLQTHRPGGRQVAGVLWHSRQADLHARSRPTGLLADLLTHRPAEVAVVWHPHGPATPFRATGNRTPLVNGGAPSRLLTELSALIATPIV